jgi:hypothetical protein
MARIRFGGIGLPDADDFDVEFAVTVEGDDEDVVEAVAMAARERGVQALQAFDTGTHPDECDGVPVAIDWDDALEGRDPTGSTDEDMEADADSDE